MTTAYMAELFFMKIMSNRQIHSNVAVNNLHWIHSNDYNFQHLFLGRKKNPQIIQMTDF